jgi:type II secretory pathway pseudopilin PulG
MKLVSKSFVISLTAVVLVLILAAIAAPSFINARNTSCQNACINNLRMIDSGKEQAALANEWPVADDCAPSNVAIARSAPPSP